LTASAADLDLCQVPVPSDNANPLPRFTRRALRTLSRSNFSVGGY
jgi:hypothetical protein